MNKISSHKDTKPQRVQLCFIQPGLAWFEETLVFVSEYWTVTQPDGARQRDAYCVETGEYFMGGARTVGERNCLFLEPITDLRAFVASCESPK
jgi:hypothetical protein